MCKFFGQVSIHNSHYFRYIERMDKHQIITKDVFSKHAPFIPAPEFPEAWDAWRRNLMEEANALMKVTRRPRYNQEAQAWASRAYAMGFVMLWDQELIDHQSGEWKVEDLCARAEREFGGYDC